MSARFCSPATFCIVLARQPGAPRQIAGQLLRAGTSVGANAEEAKAAFTRREFACKNSVVLREARESRFWLRVIAANRLMPPESIAPLLAEANELIGIYTATVKKGKRGATRVVRTLWERTTPPATRSSASILNF